MDYTTLAQVISYMDSESPNAATILPSYITSASRLIDRICTSQPLASDNYFMMEDVAGEQLTNGVIDYAGRLTLYPHKPIVNSVSALSYRYNLRSPFIVADLTQVSIEQEAVVLDAGIPYSEKIYATINYNGGLAANTADLPFDFTDLIAVQVIRLYKEARSGMGDSIGVAELGTMIYTKAFPTRVIDTLTVGGYMRIAPWT